MTGDAVLGWKRRPKIGIDIEGVVAGTYEEEMHLINEDRNEHHMFNEMVEYPRPGITVFGLSYEQHTQYRVRTWTERWRMIPRYVGEHIVMGMALVGDPSWITAAGDGGALPYVEQWIATNYANLHIPIVMVPKGSDKTALDFDLYIDDAPRLAYSITTLYRKMPDSDSKADQRRPKMLVTPRWPYTPPDIHTLAPEHIFRVASSPAEAFMIARDMLRDEERAAPRTPAHVKSC